MASAKRIARHSSQRSGYRQRYGYGHVLKGHDAEKRPPRNWTEVLCVRDKLYMKPSIGAIRTKCGKCHRVFHQAREGYEAA